MLKVLSVPERRDIQEISVCLLHEVCVRYLDAWNLHELVCSVHVELSCDPRYPHFVERLEQIRVLVLLEWNAVHLRLELQLAMLLVSVLHKRLDCFLV